ncbi:AbrB/MazE/SpoVT family DNA-binding domain-containing protein [Caproicibacterium amylolyticum]|uniref:AbrB/MazE/SpoVT family DNA-binding domain-containing protein n=1 Tax=Caproicibacterium amylolyticum TaxID=2766537 RepID=A0A7G9WG35_9FIRM|nr:AbrB/MazE/SpoVT family DNA-binding domain-containing protein [Caproicibacterium amylolyticum]QNO17647.1 AbrB/MazE/SpoVT family DNA-binding domain-containing protein [Caproicibacterium amylolyticum]
MRLLETSAAVDRKGRLRIPEEVSIQLELSPGDEIRALICDDSHTLQALWREFVSRQGVEDEQDPADNEALEEVVLPGEMLAQAGFRAGDELDAVCGERKIVITASDEAPGRLDPLDSLPDDLRRLCGDLGFNPDTVRNAMRKGGYFRE